MQQLQLQVQQDRQRQVWKSFIEQWQSLLASAATRGKLHFLLQHAVKVCHLIDLVFSSAGKRWQVSMLSL